MKKKTRIIIGFSTLLTSLLTLTAVSCGANGVGTNNSSEITKLNSAANAVLHSVENSEKIYASDVKKETIKIKNIDDKKYKINIEDIYKIRVILK